LRECDVNGIINFNHLAHAFELIQIVAVSTRNEVSIYFGCHDLAPAY
jgi:hypothetical protein